MIFSDRGLIAVMKIVGVVTYVEDYKNLFLAGRKFSPWRRAASVHYLANIYPVNKLGMYFLEVHIHLEMYSLRRKERHSTMI